MIESKFEWTAPKLARNSSKDETHVLRYTVNGKAYRIRSGHCLMRPDLKPNQVRGSASKKMWNTLILEISKLLERGINPMDLKERIRIAESGLSLGDLFQSALSQKQHSRISETYKRDLQRRGSHFLKYLSEKKYYHMVPEEFHTGYANVYMDQFNEHSETYFNNIKRCLSAVFQLGVDREFFKVNPFSKVKLKRQIEQKHVPFSLAQIKRLMDFMKEREEFNLMLVAHFTYFSFLRPGQEVRLLKRGDFTEDLGQIILSGSRTKNKQRKVVHVHESTLAILNERNIRDYSSETNIFSGSEKPLNEYYFNTRWNRFRNIDETLGSDPSDPHEAILLKGQSLYSFRHSAAIEFYKKYKDIAALKNAMSHGSVSVTEKYLRGLGVFSDEFHNYVPGWE